MEQHVMLFSLTFQLFFFLPFLSADDVTDTSSSFPEIEQKWRTLDGKISTFLDGASGIETLQQAYDNAVAIGEISFESVDGNQLVKEIANSLGDIFAKKVRALKIAAEHAEQIAADYKWDENLKKVDCLYAKQLNDTIEPFAYDAFYGGQIVSLDNSTVHIPVDIFKGNIDILNSIAWTSGLDEVWKKNKEQDPSLVWQYFGSRTGVLRSYPATTWKNKTVVDLYDVRRTKWYTQGMSSPKDMLILIEKSGSAHGQALELIKHSVRSIIDTLGENDFVNIANFSDKAQLAGCFHTFVQATGRNKAKLKSFLDEMLAHSVANYSLGFEFAFQEFANFTNRTDENQGANCNQIIMLFTDGTSDVPIDTFKKYNSDKRIRIFTYAVGPAAGNRSVGTRQIGCLNRGLFYPIPAMGAIRAAVQGYLSVLAPSLVMASGARKIKWISPHQDEMDMGLVLAVTMPVFHKANGSSNFNQTVLGMMGVDVTLKELENTIRSEMLGPNGYAFVLNSNGIVMFHPALAKYEAGVTNPVIDFAEIEEETPEREQIRREMIDQITNSVEITGFVTGSDADYTDKEKRTYHYTAIPGTQFSVAIVIPDYVKNHVSTKHHVDLDEGITLLRSNESQILFDQAKICKKVDRPPETNETLESFESLSVFDEFLEMLSSNTSDCDAEASQKLLFDVRITSSLEDKWTGKEHSQDQEQDSNDLVTTDHDQDQEQDSNDLVTTDRDQDQEQDSNDLVTTDRDQDQDSNDLVTTNRDQDQEQDSNDLVTKEYNQDQEQDSNDLVTNDHNQDQKQDLNDLQTNETISDDKTREYNDSQNNRIERSTEMLRDAVDARFVTTGKDFTRVYPQGAIGSEDKEEQVKLNSFMERLYKRVLSNDVWTFVSYPQESEGNQTASLIFASRAVSLKTNNYKAAMVGVRLTPEQFQDLVLNDDLSGCVSSDPNSVCYVLDDGGFVLSADVDNFESSVGMFYGKVEVDVMKSLIEGGIYEGHTDFDYQAVCIDEIIKSAGYRIVPPFIYEILSLNWWTTATTWSYLNLVNIYSWLFATEVTYVVAAAEDDIIRRACIKSSFQYHFGKTGALSGEAGCDNCTRMFAASRLQSTNLLVVSIHGESCNCDGSNITHPGNEEIDFDPLITSYSETNCIARVRYRKRPPCYDTNPYEPNSYCGASSIFITSHFHISMLASIILTKLLFVRFGGC